MRGTVLLATGGTFAGSELCWLVRAAKLLVDGSKVGLGGAVVERVVRRACPCSWVGAAR